MSEMNEKYSGVPLHQGYLMKDENVALLSVTAKSDQHPAPEIGSVGSHSKLLRLFPRRDRVQGNCLYINPSENIVTLL